MRGEPFLWANSWTIYMLLTFCPNLLWEPYSINIANIANISPRPTSRNMLHEMARVIGVTLVEGDLFHTRILLQMCNCNQFETSYRPAAKQLQYIPGASNFDNIELIFMYKATYV